MRQSISGCIAEIERNYLFVCTVQFQLGSNGFQVFSRISTMLVLGACPATVEWQLLGDFDSYLPCQFQYLMVPDSTNISNMTPPCSVVFSTCFLNSLFIVWFGSPPLPLMNGTRGICIQFQHGNGMQRRPGSNDFADRFYSQLHNYYIAGASNTLPMEWMATCTGTKLTRGWIR